MRKSQLVVPTNFSPSLVDGDKHGMTLCLDSLSCSGVRS